MKLQHSLGCILSLQLAAIAAVSAEPMDEWTGSTQQKIWGLMNVWAEVRYTFPHFEKRPELDWDATVQEFIPRVVATQTLDEYYAELLELVALLEDSHTSIVPPWGRLRPGYDMAPVELRMLNSRFFISRTGENAAMAKQGIRTGMELLAVDAVPVGTVFREKVQRYNSQGSKHADEAVLPIYLLYGPAGSEMELLVRDLDGREYEVTVPLDAMSGDGPPFMTHMIANLFAAQSLRSETLPGTIQYVEIPNFDHPQMLQEFEELVDQLAESDVTGMIIDLRYNMGGSSAVSQPMVAGLIDAPVSSPTMKYRHFVGAHQAWGRETLWETAQNEIEPRDGKRYLGPLVVLTSGLTNSSAEDFAIELRSAGRARLVGQQTAGGAGNALVSALPGGGTLRVATFTALLPDGTDYVGVGIAPDVEVWPTPEDLAAGRDPAIDRAIELLLEIGSTGAFEER